MFSNREPKTGINRCHRTLLYKRLFIYFFHSPTMTLNVNHDRTHHVRVSVTPLIRTRVQRFSCIRNPLHEERENEKKKKKIPRNYNASSSVYTRSVLLNQYWWERGRGEFSKRTNRNLLFENSRFEDVDLAY